MSIPMFNCDPDRFKLAKESSKGSSFHALDEHVPEDGIVYRDQKHKIQKISRAKRHSKDVKVLLACLTPFIKEFTGLRDEEGTIIQELAVLQTDPGAHCQQLHLDFDPNNTNTEKTFLFIIPIEEHGSLYVHSLSFQLKNMDPFMCTA